MSTIIATTDLQNYIGGTLSADILQWVVNAVNATVERRTHRVWGQTVTVTETYDYEWPLWLRNMDIQNVAEIVWGYPNIQQITFPPDAFFFNQWGRITMFYALNVPISPRNNDILQVTYTYGNQTVPDDLIQATLALGQRLYNFITNGGQDIVQYNAGTYHIETIGAVRGTMGTGTEDVANNTSILLLQTIDSYAMQRF